MFLLVLLQQELCRDLAGFLFIYCCLLGKEQVLLILPYLQGSEVLTK